MASSSPDRYRWLYAAVAVCSLALNLPWLATIGAWRDEAATRSASTRALEHLWPLLHQTDAVLGVYYVFLHGWTNVFGSSWFAMRLPSALAVAAAAAIATACGRIVGGHIVAVLTGAVMVLLPGVVWAGLDARPTALATFLVTAALWCWLRSAPVARWPVFAFLAGAALVQLTSLLQLITLFNKRSIRSVRFWLSLAITMVVIAPLAVVGKRQVAQVGWIHTPWNTQLSSALFGRVSDGPQSAVVLTSLSLITNVLLSVTVAALVVYAAVTIRTPVIRRLLSWAYLPPLIAIGVGILTGSSQYVSRYFASSLPAVAILVAAAISRIPLPRGRWVVAAAVVVLCLPAVIAQRAVDGKWGENLLAVAQTIESTPRSMPVFYVDNAISVGIAYPTQVAAHRQLPDPRDAATSASLWGRTTNTREVIAALPRGADALVVLPTKQAPGFSALLPNACTITRTVPGKRFTVDEVHC